MSNLRVARPLLTSVVTQVERVRALALLQEAAIDAAQIARLSYYERARAARLLFRQNFDTVQIAALFGIDEPEAVGLIQLARERVLGERGI